MVYLKLPPNPARQLPVTRLSNRYLIYEILIVIGRLHFLLVFPVIDQFDLVQGFRQL